LVAIGKPPIVRYWPDLGRVQRSKQAMLLRCEMSEKSAEPTY